MTTPPTPPGVYEPAVIDRVDRLPNSVSGNPRWRVYFEGGRMVDTKRDAAVNFGISDYIGKPVTVVYDHGEIKSIGLV